MNKRCENCVFFFEIMIDGIGNCSKTHKDVKRDDCCSEWIKSESILSECKDFNAFKAGMELDHGMTNNTHRLLKQIEELRAIADKFYFLAKQSNHLNLYDYSGRVIFYDALKRYNKEKESR